MWRRNGKISIRMFLLRQKHQREVGACAATNQSDEGGVELMEDHISRFMCHFDFIVLFFNEITQMSARTEMEH